ncbi:cytochrome c biogenesis protein CcsA [Bdellovibrionota bacterium FG-1]
MKIKPYILGFVLAGLLGAAPVFAADEAPAPVQRADWSFARAREIPLQSGGRVKPLDSFAREIMLFETGSRSFDGWDPVDMAFSMIANPEAWQNYRFIQVSREDVRRQVGLDEKRTRFSPKELMGNTVLGQYAQTASAQDQQVSAPMGNKPKVDPRDQEFKRVFERLDMFNRVISGEAWTVIPALPGAISAKPGELAPWGALSDPDKMGSPVRDLFVQIIRAYESSNQAQFESAVVRARASIESQIVGWTETAHTRIDVESIYNHIRPFLWSWIFYLIAVFVWMGARFSETKMPTGRASLGWTAAALSVTGVAFAVHVAGIAMRCFVAGRPPVTNMYESVIWVAFGQLVFAGILYAIHRQAILLLVASVLATLSLIAADAAPAVMDPSLNPLVPVLRSNYWLTIHVLTITLGYAAFALTLGLANVALYYFLRSNRPGGKLKITSMNQLTYRAMQFGVVLLAAGTILGGVWADYSWGRFWGWDPKEVWALIALLCYITILHGRYSGWVGQFGFAAWSVVAFLSVMMAWYGVNFVLGVGLHSYGFVSGGGFKTILGFVAVQMAYVIWVGVVYKRREAKA